MPVNLVARLHGSLHMAADVYVGPGTSRGDSGC